MTKVKLLPLLLLISIGSYTASQQFHQQRNPLCQSVEKLLNCSSNLEKYVKSDFYDRETFDNCTRTMLLHKYRGRGEEWLLKECTQQEAILFLTELLHQYRRNFPVYLTRSDLLLLARSVSANIRYLLRNIAISGAVMKMAALSSVVRDLSIPMAVAVDITQFTMEMMGFERKAKTVGAVGTILSGALAGFSLASVPGSVVGAGIGFFTWMATEKMKDDRLREIGKYRKA